MQLRIFKFKKQRFLLATTATIFVLSSAFLGDGESKSKMIKRDFSVAESQYRDLLKASTDITRFPRTTDKTGAVVSTDVWDWTQGFFAGGLWYIYEYTGKPEWKAAATKWTEALEQAKFLTQHHDVGFVMYCSYGNAIRFEKDPKKLKQYQTILIQSAESALARFDPKVGLIKSWNTKDSWDKKTTWTYPVIIDNMMNLEMLFYVSKLTGNPKYKDVAISHALHTMKNHFRNDYSTYHVVDYASDGSVLHQQTNQGYADNSTWARGQGWAIYGYTMMYRETKDKRFLEAAQKAADFYINHPNLPKDKIPYWDFNAEQPGYKPDFDYQANKLSYIPRDASAASLTTSALLELSTYSNRDKRYFDAAEQMLQSLSSKEYLASPGSNSGFILKHSTGSLPHKSEIDVPLIYADYYFLEALLRYQKLKN